MSRVLVVDDEKSIRDTLCMFLKKEGFDAESAPDATVALQMFDYMEFDVVLTDIIMPRLSGMELLSNIRKNSQTVQIIIMTGEPTVDTAVEAVRNGANDYLSKPINKESLIKAVKKAVQIKQLHDEKAALEKQNQLYQRTLEEMVDQRTQELSSAMQSIISLLSTVVEVRDPYTAGHQVRVGNLSAAVAKKMNLSDKTIDFVRIIGYIHDIGKIVIPTEMLSKPGILSSLEMQMIKNHPVYGYEMITKVNLPALIGETILQHHERCNGSGYPNAIKNDEISIEAKILMVADVVEAMMSHRPYRPALGLRAALEEIKQNAGILYDPQIVNVCFDLFEKDNYEIDGEEYKISFPI
jgi:putative two-component system response regulator